MNAIITGASSGIGQALALQLAEQGSTIVLAARRVNKLNSLATQIQDKGGIAHVVPTNLENEEHVEQLALTSQSLMPTIDVVVHNAGRGLVASVEDTSTELWQRMITLNATAPFWLTRALLPRMKQQNKGHHIFVSSMAGKIGYPYNAAYVAAKHALVGFVAALRGELITTSINATVICPSGVATEWGSATEGQIINDFYATALPRSRQIARDNNLTLAPLKKMLSAEQVAAIIMDVIATGRCNDIYTHQGTEDLAVQAQTNRISQEEEHRALWMAMHEAYKRM